MRLLIKVGDEGPTDYDLRDGDILEVRSNSVAFGAEELKKFLCVEMEEYGGTQGELVEPEYGSGTQPGGFPVYRNARKYYLPYWEKLLPDELAQVRDPAVSFPASTKFGLFDITRK